MNSITPVRPSRRTPAMLAAAGLVAAFGLSACGSESEAASDQELQDWVRKHLAGFKVPAKVRFVDSVLPRNANGKILKSELRKLLEAEQDAA